ncbi:hypothetical protein B0T26DRAFT_690832 [Lasiosphaeria miniovina]|uniref:Uncharacterized protein n=1 Tax=Lasiosphaeria miniovina TaxID=1954250 RepID=A0AA40EGV0_9PEZI|nr:uncharacterized protein B0T26DRAFT_690832 [Lasiosphaeria miniovina]KAK0735108.1 hypothetical protein B0T26DRAFT_690832 [Lasiosphaeria miniovina]
MSLTGPLCRGPGVAQRCGCRLLPRRRDTAILSQCNACLDLGRRSELVSRRSAGSQPTVARLDTEKSPTRLALAWLRRAGVGGTGVTIHAPTRSSSHRQGSASTYAEVAADTATAENVATLARRTAQNQVASISGSGSAVGGSCASDTPHQRRRWPTAAAPKGNSANMVNKGAYHVRHFTSLRLRGDATAAPSPDMQSNHGWLNSVCGATPTLGGPSRCSPAQHRGGAVIGAFAGLWRDSRDRVGSGAALCSACHRHPPEARTRHDRYVPSRQPRRVFER